jgi:hypothetical protein
VGNLAEEKKTCKAVFAAPAEKFLVVQPEAMQAINKRNARFKKLNCSRLPMKGHAKIS